MEIRIAKDVKVPMRDGVELATDIYRETDDPRPAVVIRIPYDKDTGIESSEVLRFLEAGYTVVAQDTRGRFASDGVFEPFRCEQCDGEDTLAWIARQNWSDGNVAMIGRSYLGATQWMAAAGDTPTLRAIAPGVTSSAYYDGWTYHGGAFQLGFNLLWSLGRLALGEARRGIARGTHMPADLFSLIAAVDNIAELYQCTPLTGAADFARIAPYYLEWLNHATDDDYWRGMAPREHYEQVNVPSLNIGGWYDIFLGGTLENYRGMADRGGTDSARRSRLIVGPWAHGVSGGEFPSGSFGLAASSGIADIVGAQIRFFDHYVRGIENGIENEPPVRIFVMGANCWRNENNWPLPDTAYTPYYLSSAGRANGGDGDGVLLSVPAQVDNFDSYLYDPRYPVPTVGGQTYLPGHMLGVNSGPRDRREIETRPDMLCYSTSTLDEDIEVTGPISLILHVCSSALDTDFTGALVDVHPNGRAVILTEGILRARYRSSARKPELMRPGTVYEITLDLLATSNVFKVGHKIRLEVSSSNFPRFDRNSNTGGVIAEECDADFLPALNRILHGPGHQSRLMLPVIDRR